MSNLVEGMITCDCGHRESKHSEITRGYGTDNEGKTYCYDCCNKRDIESIERGETFTGYVSTGFTHISNWPGYRLLRITEMHEIAIPFRNQSYISTKYYAISAIDNTGKYWYGRGYGEGVYITMRRSNKSC